MFPPKNHKLPAQPFAFSADREAGACGTMLSRNATVKTTAAPLRSGSICDCPCTFCSACARIHPHLRSDQVETPDLKHHHLQPLTPLHREKQLDDLIKII